MITDTKKIESGIFDSAILRKNIQKSTRRNVVCYELELFVEENGISYVNDIPHPIRRGMLLMAKPNAIRYSKFPVRCYFIRVFPGADEDLEKTLETFPECFYIENEDAIIELTALFSRLANHTTNSHHTPWRTMQINADIYTILYKCIRLWNSIVMQNENDTQGKLVREAYEYISENFTRPLKLSELADAFHTSPNHLHLVFKENLGITPAKLITQFRIERAKKMISSGEKSMIEIALEVGFCSQSHFNKVFLKSCGMTPATYRKSLIEKY